jgi:hypothetical protein
VIARLHSLFSGKAVAAEKVDLNVVIREVIALCADGLHRNQVVLRQEIRKPPTADNG